MPARIDVANGTRFGRLTVVSEVPKSEREAGRRSFNCLCDCGNSANVQLSNLRSGITSSCGCLRRDLVAKKNRKHGMRLRSEKSAPEYTIWKRMRQRCNDPNNHEYSRYGGRGISVCKRWDDFTLFLSDVGERPSKSHSLDRIDNGGNYDPGNVKWSTNREQCRNKRNNLIVNFRGKDMCLADAVDLCDIPYKNVHQRLRLGWDIERAVSTPIKIQAGRNNA